MVFSERPRTAQHRLLGFVPGFPEFVGEQLVPTTFRVMFDARVINDIGDPEASKSFLPVTNFLQTWVMVGDLAELQHLALNRLGPSLLQTLSVRFDALSTLTKVVADGPRKPRPGSV